MMHSPIGEAELHAYVDGQLGTARRAEVEAFLAANADAAMLVQHSYDQMRALHRNYDAILNEPVPLRLTNVLQSRPWPRGIAAGISLLVCGLVAGWFAHTAVQQPAAGSSMFAQNALVAHILYAAETRHAVEVPATQEAHLVAWLSKRLDAPIHAPDLQAQGFSLLGGRLLPSADGPLAQLMYESARSERLTLTVKHAAQQEQTGFQIMEQRGTSVFYWIDRDYGYALSGSIDRAHLLAVAQTVERQLQP
jgi:anti-sigma factor RsiW